MSRLTTTSGAPVAQPASAGKAPPSSPSEGMPARVLSGATQTKSNSPAVDAGLS